MLCWSAGALNLTLTLRRRVFFRRQNDKTYIQTDNYSILGLLFKKPLSRRRVGRLFLSCLEAWNTSRCWTLVAASKLEAGLGTLFAQKTSKFQIHCEPSATRLAFFYSLLNDTFLKCRSFLIQIQLDCYCFTTDNICCVQCRKHYLIDYVYSRHAAPPFIVAHQWAPRE